MRPSAVFTLILWLAWTVPGRAREAPDWLKAEANVSVPDYASAASAVVLLNDTTLEMDQRGDVTEIHRVALRVLHNSGRKRAVGLLTYNGASSKVLYQEAWIMRDGAEISLKGQTDWLDVASNAPGAAIDEVRSRSIDLSVRALRGDVMGYETRVKTPLVVMQLYWNFGESLPQVLERFTLSLPPGFTASHEVFGPLKPVLTNKEGGVWSWSLADQPYRPEEPDAPGSARTNAELLIQIHVPATTMSFKMRTFSSWAEVTVLYEELNKGQCDTNPALAAKVRELTAGEESAEGIIRKLAAYVQQIRYVGINRGLRYGYGWRARKATEIFSSGFGDCKDKTNLMIAMLRESGLTAHPAIANLDRDRVVRDGFPSPIQFNHAITAIEVPDTVNLRSVVPVAGLGRVLFFDPTNPYTMLGDLSLALQGGYVHIATPGVGGLIKLPEFSAADGFRIERRVEMNLTPDGALALKGRVGGFGQEGARMRQVFEGTNLVTDLDKLTIRQLASVLKTASVGDATTSDDRLTGECALSFKCTQLNYLQQIPGATAVLKLDVLSRQHLPNLAEKQRVQPVDLVPLAVNDDIELRLPPGFVLDEVPRKTALESPYGSFSVEYESAAGVLSLKRRLAFHRQLVPVEQYPQLRQFLADITRADRSAVLIRKTP